MRRPFSKTIAKVFTSISQFCQTPQGKCVFYQRTPISRVILFLIGIELFFTFVFAFAGPFVSVFIVKGMNGATISIVGIASMVFLITKSLTQIPLSRIVDRFTTENHIVGLLSFGHIVTALCPLILAFSASVWQVLLAQFFCGLGNALTYPSWNALFTNHVDKKQVAFEWSVYDTTMGLAAAGATTLGGFLIDIYGFKNVFLGVGIIIFLSAFLPLALYKRFGSSHEHL